LTAASGSSHGCIRRQRIQFFRIDPLQTVAAPFRHGFEIGTGAEIAAGAPEHGDRCSIVALEVEEGVRQSGRCRAIDGIANLGPVENHRGDWAILLDANRLRAHGCSPPEKMHDLLGESA
jgi:hypothetical protein